MDWIYVEDILLRKFFVLSKDYEVIWKLEMCINDYGSPLLPPILKICLGGSSKEEIHLANNERYKYIYICHLQHFIDYKIFYMKGMAHMYCINDERFIEKTKVTMR